MADGIKAANVSLENTIPIADLTEHLTEPATRSVKAIVTLTWPYSSATGSVAFLLAEPDFRLRRSKGQVRVQFSGSSARYIAKAGIASGDEVTLCLDGVDWVQDQAEISTPGRGIEYELKFTERLLLKYRPEDSDKIQLIDIDHPTPEPEVPVRNPSPEQAPTPSLTPTSIYARPGANNGNEFYSPAFIKRARTSYGSLFDGDYDPFAEEDGSVRGKGRKRTRLSSTWRYESRSPTPEFEEREEERPGHVSAESGSAPAPMVTSEATQTIESAIEDAAESLAELSRHEATGALLPGSHTYEPAGAEKVDFTHTMLPHLIQTQSESAVELPSTQSLSLGALVPPAPTSPRLQSISSDGLPLVSPLVTSKLGLFSDPPSRPSQNFSVGGDGTSRDPVVGGDSSFQVASVILEGGKMSSQVSEPLAPKVPVDIHLEDHYGVSPVSHHNERQSPLNNTFGDPAVELTGFDILNEAQPLLEHQYGHWQAARARLSPTTSPHRNEDKSKEQPDLFDVERNVDGHFEHDNSPTFRHDGLNLLSSIEQEIHHYPEPDDELHVPAYGTDWLNRGPADVAYPELQDPDYMQPTSRLSLLPQAAFSREQSAQSEVVDLIEGGEEQEEIVPQDEVDEESYDGSEQCSGDEEHYRQESPVKSLYFQKNGDEMGDDEESESFQGEEEFAEDQFEEAGQYGRYPDNGFDAEEEEGEEDDKESYDEDMEEEQGLPVEKGPPVFIDLLSSDDEEIGEQSPPKPAVRTPQYGRHTDYPENEESPDREVGEGRAGVPYAKGGDLASSPLNQFLRNSAREDNVEASGFEDDHESIESFGRDEREVASDAGSETPAYAEETEHEERHHEDPANQPPSPLKHTRGEDDLIEVGNGSPPDDEHDLVGSGDKYIDGPSLNSSKIKSHYNNKTPLLEPRLLSKSGLSLDGTSDGPTEVLYPARAREETATTPLGFAQTSQSTAASESFSIQERTLQLPTTDDTQLSRTIASQVSFSFTTGIQPTESISQKSTYQFLIDPALTADAAATVESGMVDSNDNIATQANEPEIEEITESAEPNCEAEQVKEEPGDYSIEVDVDMSGARTTVETIQVEPTSMVDNDTVLENADSSDPQIVRDGDTVKGGSSAGAEDEAPAQQPELQAPLLLDGLPSTLEESVQSSPRRSQRIGKAASVVDPTENELPSTPTSNHRKVAPETLQTIASSPFASDHPTSPVRHDASIEMALSALDSPTKHHDLRNKQPIVDLRLRLTRILRTELSEFSALKILRYHIKEKLDILAVATTTADAPERVKGGPRHYQITFNVTDPSISPSGVTEVHILRPYKDALPIVHAGDGILLRNFQIISIKNKGFGLRSEQGEASSWAVFKDGEDDAEVRGPPVEYGDVERKYFVSLKEWYRSLDSVAIAKLNRANANKGK